jgi:uncharacterized protein YjbI with pentapeptide repeats
VSIESRINKLEERIPKKRSLEGLTADELTDAELEEIICQGTDLTPADLTDEVLRAIARGES